VIVIRSQFSLLTGGAVDPDQDSLSPASQDLISVSYVTVSTLAGLHARREIIIRENKLSAPQTPQMLQKYQTMHGCHDDIILMAITGNVTDDESFQNITLKYFMWIHAGNMNVSC
jgi:hypothetical protein